MEVKYVNLKVDSNKYNPSNRRRRQNTRPPRRNYNSYNKRRRRKRKKLLTGRRVFILAVAALVIFLIFTIWNALTPKMPPVENLKSGKASQSSVALKWDKIKDADGYYVYAKTFEEPDFKKVATVKKKTSYTVKKLKSLTDYTLCVTSFKKFDNIVESDRRTIDTRTLPAVPVFTECKSKSEGAISLSWKSVPKAVKYQIQYVKGDERDFKSAAVKSVNASKNPSATLTGLEKSGPYCVRIRTNAKYNDQDINSDWSSSNTVYIAENFTLRSEIDPNKPMIALTFDDGPGYNKASKHILDTLEKYNAKATFFMVGRNAEGNAGNVRRKARLGMELGNHTWNHAHYGENVLPSDIKKASDAIYNICGVYPTAFRSPGGMTTGTIKAECKKENMPIYYWTIDTEDWRSRDADAVYDKVIDSVSDGDIILMHEIYNSTADAVKRMVPKLLKKGYQLVTCKELMYAKNGKAPEAGVEYISPTQVKE
ncbi:MAG: polysaccharide deacetylase family protein [Ruminococcus sp.]|nr:polysaccharide deacetylase family protein [Ruminococcus sp.]